MLNEIIVTGDGFNILSKSINSDIVFVIIIMIVLIPAIIGFAEMKNIVNNFKLNTIARIYIQTNRLAQALNGYINQLIKTIYNIDESLMECLKNDDEIHDYLKAYQGLKDDLIEIKIIHIH